MTVKSLSQWCVVVGGIYSADIRLKLTGKWQESINISSLQLAVNLLIWTQLSSFQNSILMIWKAFTLHYWTHLLLADLYTLALMNNLKPLTSFVSRIAVISIIHYSCEVFRVSQVQSHYQTWEKRNLVIYSAICAVTTDGQQQNAIRRWGFC